MLEKITGSTTDFRIDYVLLWISVGGRNDGYVYGCDFGSILTKRKGMGDEQKMVAAK